MNNLQKLIHTLLKPLSPTVPVEMQLPDYDKSEASRFSFQTQSQISVS